MKSIHGLFFASALLAGACSSSTPVAGGTELPESWPALAPAAATAGFDPAGLDALSAAMERYVDDGHVLGMEWLLVKDGAVAQYGAHGLRDAESGEPAGPDTIYRIYSMTKPITGVALMQLHEEGRFKLDDPVTDYIPEFETLKVLAGENADGSPILADLERPPTMRELMAHTAGFGYGLGGADYANTRFRELAVLRSPDMETLIDRIADIPLLFQPGERWSYSVAVDIQGYLVEKLSGMRFGEYLEANIFGPLNMDDTGFFVPDADMSRLADLMVYSSEAGEFVSFEAANSPFGERTLHFQFSEDAIPFESGGGGLVSTLDDYARFCQMMLNGGALSGKRTIEPETVALMTANQLPDGAGIGFDGTQRNPEDGEPHHFGLGWGVITDPAAMKSPAGAGTYYWGGAAGTWFWIDPENDLFFIGMIQRFGTLPGEEADFRGESMRLVYEALAE